MIVWGGQRKEGVYQYLNTGGRYDPATDSWRPTSTGENVPAGRFFHSVAWTGTQMVVWGGDWYQSPSYHFFNSGGRYDPLTDRWLPTSTGTNVPTARAEHTSAWTGSELIVWGGRGDEGFLEADTPGTGGRYCISDIYLIVYRDADGDGYGDPTTPLPLYNGTIPGGWVVPGTDCNDADPSVHPTVAEACDGVDNDCDGSVDEDASGEDSDSDGVRNVCDNCVLDPNQSQSDVDDDGVGNACDLNDGLIYVPGTADSSYIGWQQEQGPTSWNLYVGDLNVLRATGVYTQAPGSNSLADRQCGLTDLWAANWVIPTEGAVEFLLVTGVAGGVEGSLGTNGAGVTRPNTNPCP